MQQFSYVIIDRLNSSSSNIYVVVEVVVVVVVVAAAVTPIETPVIRSAATLIKVVITRIMRVFKQLKGMSTKSFLPKHITATVITGTMEIPAR